jgi:hypothetical protein
MDITLPAPQVRSSVIPRSSGSPSLLASCVFVLHRQQIWKMRMLDEERHKKNALSDSPSKFDQAELDKGLEGEERYLPSEAGA